MKVASCEGCNLQIAHVESTPIADHVSLSGIGWRASAQSRDILAITFASTSLNTEDETLSIAFVAKEVASKLRGRYQGKGYIQLHPDHEHIIEKKSLSWWRQCHVVRIKSMADGKIVKEETHMGPISIGTDDNSISRHSLSFCISKRPYIERLSVQLQLKAKDDARPQDDKLFPPGTYVWTSYHGNKLRCGAIGNVDLAPRAEEWEHWRPVWKGGNTYYWKSFHGTYLRANWWGTVDAVHDPREWEEWECLKLPSGFVWRSYHGTYLSAFYSDSCAKRNTLKSGSIGRQRESRHKR